MPEIEAKPVYYIANIGPRLDPHIEEVYGKWSGLKGDALLSHLHHIRELAWPIAPYPCTGSWLFCFASISKFAIYPELIKRIRNGAQLLDLGCCFGQDLRLLAADGAPTNTMYASDLHGELWNIGFDLFNDRGRMHAQFIQADVLEGSSRLDVLDGKIDIILICQLLHLWDWDRQLVAMRRIARLSKVGTVLVGYQRGREKAASSAHPHPWSHMFIHDLTTFANIWKRLGEETNTTWVVDARLVELEEWGMEPEDKAWMDQPPKGLNFVITRKQ